MQAAFSFSNRQTERALTPAKTDEGHKTTQVRMMPMPISPWQKRTVGALLALSALFCAACGGSGLNEVQGTVLHQGQPAKGAVVLFHPKDKKPDAQIPSGTTGDDGKFTLMTGLKSGAPAGDYNVAVTWPMESTAVPKAKRGSTDIVIPEQPDRLKGRYADPNTSALTATIKSGRNTLNPFDVK